MLHIKALDLSANFCGIILNGIHLTSIWYIVPWWRYLIIQWVSSVHIGNESRNILPHLCVPSMIQQMSYHSALEVTQMD